MAMAMTVGEAGEPPPPPPPPPAALEAYLEAVATWCERLRSAVEAETVAAAHATADAVARRRNRGLPTGSALDAETRDARRAAAAEGDPVAIALARDEALMFVQYVSEDIKARQANLAHPGPLHQQLELMAANIKSIAVALHACSGADVQDSRGNDEEDRDDEDDLLAWGEQLSAKGSMVLEDRHRIKSVACNGQRGLYVTHNGDVFSIGEDGTGAPSSTSPGIAGATNAPRVVGQLVLERVLLGRRVVVVACGHLHSCALTQGGRLWSWGCGQHGRLGHGDERDQPDPRLCESLLSRHVRAVACGGAHTVAVVSPSRVFSWGLSRNGRLGLGVPKAPFYATPQLVDVDNHALAVSNLYHATFGRKVSAYVQEELDEPVVGVACGWAFTLLLGANSTVRAFGAGTDGQCGIAPMRDHAVPEVVPALSGLGVVQISCGYHHAMAVTAAGRIYTWGMGEEGQLGHGREHLVVPDPRQVQFDGTSGAPVTATLGVAGQFHSICSTGAGQLWGWGNNAHGAVDPEEHTGVLWRPRRVTLGREGGEHGKPIGGTGQRKGGGRAEIKQLGAGGHFSIAVARRPARRSREQATALGPDWFSPETGEICHDAPGSRKQDELRAAAALVPQIHMGSFCGGRIGFWLAGRFLPRIGVLTSTGALELYLELSSREPEQVVLVHGHDVELQCKGKVLEAWRVRPGEEFSLLLRLELGSEVEVIAWAHHLAKHTTTERQGYLAGRELGARNSLVHGRQFAWQSAIGNQLRITPELYVIYKERATRQEGIGLDVKRTLPTLLLFGKRGEPLYEQLREVLEVYQCYRPDVGYVQGMSYIAAMLCLHVPNNALQSFSCLANLLVSHHLFDFFRLAKAYDRVERYYEVLDVILAKSAPKLWRHLQRQDVLGEVHVTCFQWLQTLFVRRLPLEQATQLWDAFLCGRDTMVMMRACVAVLLCLERSILAVSEPEDVLLLLRSQRRLDDVVKKSFTAVQVPPAAQRKLAALLAPGHIGDQREAL